MRCASALPPAAPPLPLPPRALLPACQPGPGRRPRDAAAPLPLQCVSNKTGRGRRAKFVRVGVVCSGLEQSKPSLKATGRQLGWEENTRVSLARAKGRHPVSSWAASTAGGSHQHLSACAVLSRPPCAPQPAQKPGAVSPTAASPWQPARPPLPHAPTGSAAAAAPPAQHTTQYTAQHSTQQVMHTRRRMLTHSLTSDVATVSYSQNNARV